MIHPKMRHIYVGVDIHKATHTAVIIDCFGEKLGEITFNNKPSEYEGFLKEVKRHSSKGITPLFGLEDVHSLGRALTVFLLSKKLVVKYVCSSLTYSERKNQSILHKTDSHDALCVARVLLNRFNELQDANPQDNYWILDQLVGRRRSIVKASVAIKKHLHTYIMHHYPSYKQFFREFDRQTAVEFWEKYPSPSKLKGVGVEELGAFLKIHSHNFYGLKKAEEILRLVAIDGDTSNEFQETRDFIVTSSIKLLKSNNKEVSEIEERIRSILPGFGYKLESMKGIETITAAELITEIKDINRFATPDKLAKYSGVSPVTYSSGKMDKQFANRNGDRHLHSIFFSLAVTIIGNAGGNKKPINEVFHNYYKKKLSEGKTKKQALKCVMRRLVNIIWGMMKNKTEYINPVIVSQEKE